MNFAGEDQAAIVNGGQNYLQEMKQESNFWTNMESLQIVYNILLFLTGNWFQSIKD